MQIRETHGSKRLLKAKLLHVGIILCPRTSIRGSVCWSFGRSVGTKKVGWSVGQSVERSKCTIWLIPTSFFIPTTFHALPHSFSFCHSFFHSKTFIQKFYLRGALLGLLKRESANHYLAPSVLISILPYVHVHMCPSICCPDKLQGEG